MYHNHAINVARRMERKPGVYSGISSRLPPDTQREDEYRRNGESTGSRMVKIECGRELVEVGRSDLERVGKEVTLFRAGKRRRLEMEKVKLKGRNFPMSESDNGLALEYAWEALAEKEREVAESERKVAIIMRTLDKRIHLVEEREKELDLQIHRKTTELSLKREEMEKELQRKTTELSLKEVEREKEFNLLVQIKMRELSNMAEEFVDRVKVEDEKLTKQVEKERECVILIQKGMENLELKEKQLNMKEEEFMRQVQQADKKFILREESLRHDCMKRINMAESKVEAVKEDVDKKVEEIESVCNVGWEITWDTYKDAESIRESVEKQFQDLEKVKCEFDSFQEKRRGELAWKEEQFEKMKRDFTSFQEIKMGELAAKEQHLYMMSEKLVEDALSRDEQLIKREKLGFQLVKRLESALDHVKSLKLSVGLEKAEVQSIREWVARKVVELQDEMTKMVKTKEVLNTKEHEFHLRENDLKMKEDSLLSQQRDLERQRGDLEKACGELEWRKKNLKSVKEFMSNCFKEHVALKKEAAAKKDMAEKLAKDLKHKEEQLESEKQLMAHLQEKLKHVQVKYPLEANENVDPGDSRYVKFIVTMDGKTLQMHLNDPQKDLDLMRDEILTVLQLSSDPAKIVLDAMAGFYPPHLRKGDTDSGVQRTCIVLLEQLIRMSPEISPHIRKEAIELAREWKSKMRGSAEYPWELMGFLRLLAAYDLTSCFDENEFMSFVSMVAPYS